jgi:hypothetical protein
MQKSQIDAVTLVVAALAGALALTQISGPFAWMSSIGGLTLLFLLLSFDQEGYRTVFQSLAFSAVCGFCTAIATGIIFQLMANRGEIHLANGQWATEYLPLTCAFATAIFWAIDLMRMNARKVVPIQVPRALGETRMFPGGFTPASEPVNPAPPRPVAERAAPSTAPVRAEQPTYRAAEIPQTAASAEPPVQPQPYADSPTATSIFAIPPSAVTAEAPLHPGPAPIIPRTGKETMIYVSLLGEALNVLRSVRAEPLGRDYYRIIDDMPEGETWQFQPGQVVRCKKKNLSSGKAMVAMEEAPRAT